MGCRLVYYPRLGKLIRFPVERIQRSLIDNEEEELEELVLPHKEDGTPDFFRWIIELASIDK